VPIYEYRCPACGHAFEKLVRMGADGAPPCPGCGRGGAHRLVSAIARPAGDCGPSGAT
jgi:putative FmdB family regulatory protein